MTVMEFFNQLLQYTQTLLPAILWASIMTSLCLGLLYLTTKLVGDIVNPCLIYALWLLLGVRMFLWTNPLKALDFSADVGTYIAFAWLMGSAITLARFCILHAFHYRDILRRETKLPEWLHSLFMEVREEVQVRARPTLIVTEATTVPLLMGTFRPVMVLPVNLARRENKENLRQILRHEMAHLRGGDLWFAWFWIVAISLHWFNPFLWFARRSLGLWREIACDWRTTDQMSERERLEYGRTLLVVAQSSSGSNWSGAACIAEKTCDIERRITMISKKFPKMKKRIFSNFSFGTIAILFFVGTLCFPLYHQSTAIAALEDATNEAPAITKMEPKNGAKDVDPEKTTELRVTFDRDMDTGGYSWCGGGPAYPETTGKAKWIDKRTCILPVKLKPGKTYWLGINSESFKNFQSTASLPVAQTPYTFTTTGKSEGPVIKAPVILKMKPKNGAKDVDPKKVTKLRIMFDQDMNRGFSWCGGGPTFPKTAGKPRWVDKRTCILPVKLEPGKMYRLGINSQSFKNFSSVKGLPVKPVIYTFKTKGKVVDRSPKITRMVPKNGAKDVDYKKVTKLRVTFNRDMDRGRFSWCGGGSTFPEMTGKPKWVSKRTCILPVKLEPGKTYRLGINSPSFQNFQSAQGWPVKPVAYSFTTSGK